MNQTDLSLPFFDQSHREVIEPFRRWVATELASFEASEGGDGADARTLFQRLGEAGWLVHSVPPPAAADAVAPDIRMVCLMREALGYSSAIADVAFSEPWLAVLPIALYGSRSQRIHRLVDYIAARRLIAFALSEPEAGSDAAAIGTTITPAGTGWVVDGTKTWTSNSGLADAYLVFARQADIAGRSGISAVLVDGTRPEIELRERIQVLSPHTVGTLAFASCPTTATEPLIGDPGQGFEIAMRALELFRPTVAAACIGLARRALDEAIVRCKTRRTFGRALAEHQLIQCKLADMATRVQAAATLTYQAAWSADAAAQDSAMLASMAKLFASETAGTLVDEAVQIFGGLGVRHGSVVERLYRHVRAFRIFDGTSEIQRLVIAKSVMH